MNLSELTALRKMLNHLQKEQRNSIRLMLWDEKTKLAVEIADNKEDFGADTLEERYESVKYMIKQIDFVNHRSVDKQLFPNTVKQAL
tara:strand:+ start:1125 stop:1385 length:261 start_codon:yes stop_codon:yes gene_type:complete